MYIKNFFENVSRHPLFAIVGTTAGVLTELYALIQYFVPALSTGAVFVAMFGGSMLFLIFTARVLQFLVVEAFDWGTLLSFVVFLVLATISIMGFFVRSVMLTSLVLNLIGWTIPLLIQIGHIKGKRKLSKVA